MSPPGGAAPMDISGAEGNSSFSSDLPGLQIGVDSTSLGTFITCPRKYYYSIIQGLEPMNTSVHLTFGILLHEGMENYERARASGETHEQSIEATIAQALASTWDTELGRGWISGSTTKNRLTLVRSLVWYFDHFGPNDPMRTLRLADGAPAVELSFRFRSGYVSPTTGEDILLCGHLDKVVEFNDDHYISEHKTTESELSDWYFARFTPDTQMSLYSIAGRVVFDFETRGVIVNGLQVGVGFTRFARRIIPRARATQEEWLAGMHFWLGQMEWAAVRRSWPMNDKACGLYASKESPGGCPFRPICSKEPGSREVWLKQGFRKRRWDPLVPRGPGIPGIDGAKPEANKIVATILKKEPP